MLAFISPAKTMTLDSTLVVDDTLLTQPAFTEETMQLATCLLQYSVEELQAIYQISYPLAVQLYGRIRAWHDPQVKGVAAITAYDGVVFKQMEIETASTSQLLYLQKHLCIASLLYGLLRPLDQIKPYRMEPKLRFEVTNDQRVDYFWRSIQTNYFIETIQKAGGVLLYLASKEEQLAFDWKTVKKQVKVIDFQFLQYKGDKLRTVTIYAKQARGQMIRFMMQREITDYELLKEFEWEGFTFSPAHSTDDQFVFIQGI